MPKLAPPQNQQDFDAVWNHFVVNLGERSTAGSACQYRGPNGAKCAVGVLIPDDVYDFRIEGKGIDFMESWPASVREWAEGHDTALLADMQILHDDAPEGLGIPEFPKYMEAGLRNIAKDYGLQVPGE